MTTDADGNVWFCMGLGDWEAEGRLARIDHRTAEIQYFTPPTPNSGPSSPGTDLRRNLIWFSETPADQISRFDPRTRTFTSYSLPTRHSLVRRVEVDRSHPNRIWYSGSGEREDGGQLGYSKIGYIEVFD